MSYNVGSRRLLVCNAQESQRAVHTDAKLFLVTFVLCPETIQCCGCCRERLLLCVV